MPRRRAQRNPDIAFLREMVGVWRCLSKKAYTYGGTQKGDAYTTAMDVIQAFIEDQLGGRELFWRMVR